MSTAAPSTIRVLVVDDHQVVVQALEAALAAHSDIDIVDVALTAADGLMLAARHQPDVVLLDYHLGERTALEVIPELTTVAAGTRIVVLTALAADRTLTECLRAGAAGFVTKQQSIGDVIAAIRSAAAGELGVAPALLAAAVADLMQPTMSAAQGLGLTGREADVLSLMAEGLQNREIAAQLYLSVNTVRNHVAAILRKLDARTRTEAVALAHRRGLVGDRRPPV